MNLESIISFLTPIEVQLINKVEEVKFKKIEDSDFDENSIGWCSDKNLDALFNVKSGTVILSEIALLFCTENSLNTFNKIVVKQPRKAFVQVVNQFLISAIKFGEIATTAQIDSHVKYNPSTVNIGHNVVIEKDTIIGNNVIIGSNTVIKHGTLIGDNVKIGSNNTIGGIGFGYEPDDDGNYELIPHIGNVVLEEGVEIGNNTCIDRAVLGSTLLSKNVKVDNLVHIAHGVQVGENSLVIANAMVAGSVSIGKNVWVAPSSSIRQKLTIEDNATIGMGSVVVKNVCQFDVVAGVPAKKIN